MKNSMKPMMAMKKTIEPKMSMKKTVTKMVVKPKAGKSFPDLNKDGKISKKDVLIGRGIIAKKK